MKSSLTRNWLGRVCVLALLCTPAVASVVDIQVSQVSDQNVIIQYQFDAPTLQPVEVNGEQYHELRLGKESVLKEVGAPELPRVCRSVIIPDVGTPQVTVRGGTYEEWAEVAIVPSKGFVLRTTDPASLPYTFGADYEHDAFFPGMLANVREPYVLRDYRGVTVEVYPFQYNPVTQTLRVYSTLEVEVATTGTDGVNTLKPVRSRETVERSFKAVYKHQFLNFGMNLRYAPLDEDGDLLIICHDAWLPNVAPLVTHKNQRGISTTAVGVSSIGNTHTAIKSYIQNLYNTSDLAYVLLVGDGAQIDSPSSAGGTADPLYSKLAGSDDYPEIIVGRFSAETAAQVDTQVQRTITYENLPAPNEDWFWKGIGIGSSQGAGQGDEGQADWQHLDEIRTWLMNFGYTTVNQIYDTNGGTAAQVSNALNAGRGIINYTGHGSTTAWSSTGFNNADVNALTNDNMLPFICSVACVNGEFDGYTCFAEAWMRATNGTQPTGAIGIYASSINQSWAPPMEGQDEFNLLLTSEAYASYGALCFAGSCSMMDDYGAGGVEMFDTWHIFGDPSVRIAITCVDEGVVNIDRGLYGCSDAVTISLMDCGPNLDDAVIDTVDVVISSDSEPAGETVTLSEVGAASGQFLGTIDLSSTDGAGVLQVGEGDTVTVTYTDAEYGQGGGSQVVTATAAVDCTPPVLSNVQVTDVQPREATISFVSNEPVTGVLYYGVDCNNLTWEAAGAGLSTAPQVTITGLQDDTSYFFIVKGVDEAGNPTTIDAGGTCFSFTTPEVPDFYTELFSSGFDLANKSITFTPNGTVDFFMGCVEDISALPTSWMGHTQITLGDDDDEQVYLSLGNTVSLYGASYASFYINANGYLTFGASDWDYTETLDDHFSLPRVSALFDDLSPQNGTGVYWAELSDRVVVTYVGVPEYTTTGSNTFQIELYFDGRIVLSYLGITASDGLAGLSDGSGINPDFLMSDLSGLGICETFPPTANNGQISVDMGQSTLIALSADDDGLPNPPGALTYRITSLPTYGTLSDAFNGTPITSVPHTLPSGRLLVTYDADGYFVGDETFTFEADDGGVAPDGGVSNTATVTVACEAGAYCKFAFPLDTDPAWTCDGQWQFGAPVAGGSHAGDPATAHTGNNIYGYAIGGDYSNNQGEMFLTTSAMDCTNLNGVQLRFWRWLGIEQTDNACVDVSSDGVQWTRAWSYDGLASINDLIWQQQTLDISGVADNQPTVYVRWGMGTTDHSITYPGWSLDDVELWGYGPVICAGDTDCDGDVDFDDISLFVASIGDDGTAWEASFTALYGYVPACSFSNGDMDGDTDVDFDDISPFVNKIGTACGQ
jgi:hypothetical protein